MQKRVVLLGLFVLSGWRLFGQAHPPKLIDAHMHYDGEPGFLEKLLSRLYAVDGAAFLLTTPKAFDQARPFIDKHPDRLIGFGDIKLDDPQALELIDEGQTYRVRRVTVELTEATRDGAWCLHLLTNLPEKISACQVAEL